MRITLALLVLLGAGCAHFSVGPASNVFDEGTVEGARLLLREDLAIAVVATASPVQAGERLAALAAEPGRDLLSDFDFCDFFRTFVQPALPDADELARTIPEPYRREVEAFARAADLEPEDLLRANCVADACACTAFAASGSATTSGRLVVGRNLDFAPAHVLGRTTLVTVLHPEGAHAFVSIGWPGFSAVVTGMNDAGLCAAILINSEAAPRREGILLGFLVRLLLERCASVKEARALFHASSPASGHFVFLADDHDAAVVSRDAEDRSMADGLLACVNGPLDLEPRGVLVTELLREAKGNIDDDVARSILARTYLSGQNTHAVVLVPGEREILLARGTTFAPAALGAWNRLSLARALAGDGDPVVTSLSR
ncbi:MAG TPA: C45 family peptidase [Planctomycetota bacterium]|nr:C45 family peptidase [Planctomycetota bacterium]